MTTSTPFEEQLRLYEAELARREAAQTHLADYARSVVDVIPAEHHRLICDTLEAGIDNDEWDDCVICMPPGSAKSTYVSHCFPAWYLGKRPTHNIILASHTGSLAEKWSRRVRDTVASPDHVALFPDSTLSRDSTAVTRWSTGRNGEFLAAGVGMSILGFRADCLTGDTFVRTPCGDKRLDAVQPMDYLLSYDQDNQTPTYRRVVAVAGRTADERYRIHTSSGRVVEATGNHRILANGCWVQASSIVIGDVLMCSLSGTLRQTGVGDVEGSSPGKDSVVLQHVMFDNDNQHGYSWIRYPQDMQPLREEIHQRGTRGEGGARLLGRVLESSSDCVGSEAENSSVATMRHLWENIPSSKKCGEPKILLQGVQEQGSCYRNVVGEEPKLAGRNCPVPIQGRIQQGFQGGEAPVPPTGQLRVCGVQLEGTTPDSPHQHGRDEQFTGQRSDALRAVPLETSRGRAGEIVEDTVALVERVRESVPVFDIQVEGTACFFANGILTHNCAILDDPISGWEQAQSTTQLQKVHDWYRSDLKSRLKPRAKVIVVCQRTAAWDMAGFMIKEFENKPTRRLRTIVLPMLAGEDDPLGRAPGERLWPTWYTPEMVADLQKDEFIWKTMWQQEPPSDDGSWVTADDIKIVDIVPDSLSRYLVSDLALSVNKGDYSVHAVVGVATNGAVYVTDMWRERTSVDITVAKHLELVDTYSPLESLIDDDNASKVYVQLLANQARERGIPVPWKTMPMRGQDKETRAAPLRGMFKRGTIFFKRAPWNRWIVNELLMFPNAIGSGVDDGVDALSLIGRRLSSLARPAGETPPPKPLPTTQEMTLAHLFEDNELKRGSRRRI